VLDALSSIATWARESPDDLAVVSASRRATIGETWDAARRLAGWLTAQGVGPSVGLATAVPTSLEPATLLALLIRGGLGAAYVQGAAIGEDAPMQRLFTTEAGFPGVAPQRILRLDDAARRAIDAIDPATVTPADPQPDDIIRVAYSSGTTGAPKAIALTRRQVEARLGRPRDGGLVGDDIATFLRGTSYANQLGVLGTLAERRPHLVLDKPAEALALIAEFEPKIVQGAPAQLAEMLAAGRGTGVRLEALAAVLSVGAPLAPATAAALIDWFDVEILEGYGSTEGDVVFFRRWRADAEAGAEVYPTTEVEIVGADHTPVSDGESGYVRVRTAAMASGYLGADETEPFHGFHDGWFYPGDVGMLHGRRLTLVGRDDELLNLGGQKILAPRLEAAALTIAGVRDAAAVAVPDALGISRLALAIVTDAPVARDDLAAALAPIAGGVPLGPVLVVAQLPRTESGKVRRTEVVELIRRRGPRG